MVPQFLHNLRYEDAANQAWSLLNLLGSTDSAFKREPDLSHAERFIAKLLRAVIFKPETILIDRPSLLLPDIFPPPFIERTIKALDGQLNQCLVIDYDWHKPLWPESLWNKK